MKKKIVYFLLVLMFVLGLPLTAVSAQSDPAIGAVDEDGDLVVEVLTPSEDSAGIPGGDLAGIDSLPEDLVFSEAQVSVDVAIVSPVAYAYVKDRTPTFTFTKVPGATKYQIEVYDVYTPTLVYTVKGSAVCDTTQCKITPTIELKPYDFEGEKGQYAWRVRSKSSAGWSGYSGYGFFYVISNGFHSTFDNHTNKWQALYGDWFRVDPGYVKTKGVSNQYASVIQREFFLNNYVYEVKMKRKVEAFGDTPSNRIYFMATPGSDPTDGWDGGYEFYYYDDGNWRLAIRDGDIATILASGDSVKIKPYGWNKLTVVTDLPYIDLWINEYYLGWTYVGDDPMSYDRGYVGIAGFKNTGKSSLLVDRARVEYTAGFPYPAAMSVDGLRDPAYELTVDPDLVFPVE